MDLRFSELAICDEEVAMLRRVHFYACGVKEVEPESDQGSEIGRMVLHLYQQGVRAELALMHMLTPRGSPKISAC